MGGWPWLAVGLLGIYHGLNPAMGWLFAVALGLQQRRRQAVLGALLPIAVGHEASIGLVVGLAALTQVLDIADVVRPVGALALVAFGLYKLRKPQSHPRWVGMRVSARDLVVWSFLMSTAHGAGLMLFPIVLGLQVATHADDPAPGDIAAVLLHTAAMLATMGVVAVVVYERIGVMVLRRAWVNMDAIWAVAVVAAGVATLFT